MEVTKKSPKRRFFGIIKLMSIEKFSPKTENKQELTPEQIRAIEQMPVFPNEKVELILVKTGLKSVAEIELFSDTWEGQKGEKPKKISQDKIREIAEDVKQAGLVAEVGEPEEDMVKRIKENIPEEEIKPEDEIEQKREKIRISVAADENKLKKYLEAIKTGSDTDLGKLYGFPESAIKAYQKEREGKGSFLLSRSELPDDKKAQEESLFLTFMIAKDNPEEAMETARKWAQKVEEVNPSIYREYIKWMREVENF
ncbi:MAG: hypothetical protein COU85_02775 [Candidatus Portnoybacteria bacterium CG10_big_fil_rev_8_21_14_0_10_44_7]|uniref:Uncharacterized protein n=1 Tax=Candidatus Portnoybacteria bacterium CG10_big_fil_rev_8_21_14_0_10_44_7 TaxID=1974816 RepID=A0A2M8KI69_9BACT|nr:MAG: hypothetical protein COU85_02775 [Candidatus Portnoybacteria bacterium CG10_big_fil_rev_8_21_14_0_10_44_7]